MDAPEFILTLVAMGLFSGLVFAVIRTIGGYLERRQTGGGRELARLRAEVEALRADLADHLESRQRLLELEERVDFTERLLARERDRALPKGE